MSMDSAQRDVLLDIRDSFVLSVSTMDILLILLNLLLHVQYWTSFLIVSWKDALLLDVT